MTQKTKNLTQRNRLILGGVIIVAVIVAVAFVVLSSQSSFSEPTADYSAITQARQDDGGYRSGRARRADHSRRI